MIISPGRKFIFVHIPKTGGTALSLALEDRAMADDILIGDTPKAVKRRGRVKKLKSDRRLWKHSTLSDIETLPEIGNIDDYFIVTLIRNPWDRMVSYFHWLREQKFEHRAVDLARQNDFSGFLNHPENAQMLLAESYGKYIEKRSGIEVKAIFIDLKKLKNDMAIFEDHLGFSLSLPFENQSNRDADWRVYYSDADAALVGKYYAEDITRFGYKFDPE